LLNRKAKLEEMNVIKKHATLPGTSNKVMVNDIAQNILSSSHPNALYSMSTTNALKLALYREKKKLHPLSTSVQDISGGDEVSHPSLPNQYYGWL
jgi:phage major head subunit gpT-like protein